MTENVSVLSIPSRDGVIKLGNWHRQMWEYWREADPADLDARSSLENSLSICQLWCLALHHGYYLVGYGCLFDGELALASVRPEFRRRGIYKELVRTRMDYAIKVLGLNEITVSPSEETEGYFKRIGFEISYEYGETQATYLVNKLA